MTRLVVQQWEHFYVLLKEFPVSTPVIVVLCVCAVDAEINLKCLHDENVIAVTRAVSVSMLSQITVKW